MYATPSMYTFLCFLRQFLFEWPSHLFFLMQRAGHTSIIFSVQFCGGEGSRRRPCTAESSCSTPSASSREEALLLVVLGRRKLRPSPYPSSHDDRGTWTTSKPTAAVAHSSRSSDEWAW